MMHQPFARTPQARTASATRSKRSNSASKATSNTNTTKSSPLRPHADATRSDQSQRTPAEVERSTGLGAERRPRSVVHRTHEPGDKAARLRGRPATHNTHQEDDNMDDEPPVAVPTGLPAAYALPLASLTSAHGTMSPSTLLSASSRREPSTRLSSGPTLLQGVCAAMSTMTVSRSNKSQIRSSVPRSASPPLTTSPSRPRNSRTEKEKHATLGVKYAAHDNDDEQEPSMRGGSTSKVNTSLSSTTWHAPGRAMAPVAHIRIRPLLSYLGETQEMRRVFFLDHENMVISTRHPAERAHTTGTRSDVSTSLSSTRTHGQNITQAPSHPHRTTTTNTTNNMTSHMAGVVGSKRDTSQVIKSSAKDETPLVSCSPSEVSLAAEEDEDEHGSNSRSMSNRLSEVSLNSSPADFTMQGEGEQHVIDSAHAGLPSAVPLHSHHHQQPLHSMTKAATVADLRVPSPPKPHSHQHAHRGNHTGRYKSPRIPASTHSSPLQSTTQLGSSGNAGREEVTGHTVSGEATASGHGVNTSFTGPNGPSSKTHYFSFEFIHDEDATQEDVFEESVLRFADEALLAHNVAILCYGPTGSGKTYSMMGGGQEGRSYHADTTNKGSATWRNVTDEPSTEPASRSGSSSPRQTSAVRCSASKADKPHSSGGEAREESWPAVTSTTSTGLYRPGNAALLLLDEAAAMRSLGGAHSGEMGLLPRLVLVLLDRRGVSVSLVREREEKSAAPATSVSSHGRAMTTRRPGANATTPIPRRVTNTTTTSSNTRSPQKQGAAPSTSTHPRSVSASKGRSRSATSKQAKPQTPVSTSSNSAAPMQTPRTRHATSRGLRQLSLTLQSLTFYGVELYNDELADLLDPAKRPIPNVSDLGGLEALCAQLDQARNTTSSATDNVNGSRVGEGQTPRTARARNTNSSSSCGGGMVIDTLEDLRRAYCLARRNRVTSSHKLNDTSSRSHAVFILQLSFTLRESAVDKTGAATEESNAYDEEHIRSYVVLVDLAGCERVKETQVAGTALREAQYINRSLSALSSVVLALYRRSSHIPYRDSKLTRLLRPCLQDGRVLTLVHVAPCSVTNTIHALQFADRVRHTLMPMHNRVDEGKRGLLALFEELVDPSQGQLEADLHESEQRYNVLCAEVRLAYLIRYQTEQQEREEGGAETMTSSQAGSGTETTAALGVGVTESRGGRRPRGANSKALPGATRGTHHSKGQTTNSAGETMLAPALHTLPTVTTQRHKTPSSTTTTTTTGNTTGGSKNKSRSALQEARAAALREMIAHYLAPLRANEEAETEAAIHRIEQERDRRIAACVRRCATAEARLRGALEEITKCNAQLLQENASPLPTDPYTTELTRELQRTNEAIGDTTRETQVMSGLVTTLRQRLALQEELMAATEADLQAALRREFTSSTTNIAPMPTSNLITNTLPMSSSPPLPPTSSAPTTNTLIGGGGVRPPPTGSSSNNPNDDTSFATSSWMLDTLATVTDPGTAPATTNSLLSSLPLLSTSPAEAPLTTITTTITINSSVGGGAEEQSWREVCEQQILLAKEMAALRREVVCQEMGEAVWEGLWSRAMRTHMAVALMRECAMMERILCNKDALRAWLQPGLTTSQSDTLNMPMSDSEATRFAELPATQRADWACVISYLTRRNEVEEVRGQGETVSKSEVDESVSKGQTMQSLTTTTIASPSVVSMAGVADPSSTTIKGIMPALSLVGMESTLVSSATTPYFDACGNDDEGALQQTALATLLSHGVWCEACVVTESWSSIARRYTDLVQQQQYSKNTTNTGHSASPGSSTTSSTTSSSARTSYSESEYQNNDDETEMRRQDAELRTANTSMNGRSLGQSRRGRKAAKYTDGWLLATSAATELQCGHLRLRQNNTTTNSNTSDGVQQASYVLEFCEAVRETDNSVNHTSSGDAAAAAEGHPYHSNSNNNTRASVEPPAGSSCCYFALPLSEPTLHFTIHLVESGAMDIARRPHHHGTRTITRVSEAALMSSCPFLAIEIVGVPAHVPRSAQRTSSHSPSSPMAMSGLSTHERHAAYASHVPTTNTTQGSPLSNSSMTTTTTTTTVPVSRRGSLTLPSAVWHTSALHNSSTGKDTKTTSRIAHQPSASFSPSSHFTRDGTTRCTILLRHGPPCTRHTIMSAVTQAETIVGALSALLLPSSTPLHNSSSSSNATRAAQQTGPRTQRQHPSSSTATPRGATMKNVQTTTSKATTTVTRETTAHTANESIVSVVYQHLPTALLPQAAALVKANESTLATRLGASSSSTTPRSTKAQGATGLKSHARGKALASNANTKTGSQSGNKKTAALTTATSSPALQAGTLQVFIHLSPLPSIEDWLTTNNATTTTTTAIDTAGESGVPAHNSTAFTTDAMLLAVSQLCRVVSALDSLRRAHVPRYRDEAQQLLTSQANAALPLREKAMRFVSIWLRRLRALRRHVRASVRQDIYDAEDIKGEPIPSAMQNSCMSETTSHLLEIMREANALLRLRIAPALLDQQTTHSLKLQEKDASNTSDDNIPQLPLTLTEARVLGAMWHVPWTLWQWSHRWPTLQKMYLPTTNTSDSGAQVQPQLSWAAQLTAWLAQTQQPSTSFTTAFSQRSFSPLATHREPWCSEESSSSSSSNSSSMVMMHETGDHCHLHNNHTTGKLGATTNSATQDVLHPVATTRLCLQPLPPHMTCMTTQ